MLRILLFLAMLGTAAIIIAGFGGPLHPAFDTFSHFRLHLSAGLVLLAVIWSFRCSRIPAIVFALIGFIGVASCSSGLPFPTSRYQPAGGEKVYTAFTMNLLWKNHQTQRVIDEITERAPDILLLTEISYQWIPPLEALSRRYPHRLPCPEGGGITASLILSKFPLADAANGVDCGVFSSLGLAGFMVGATPVTFGIVHLRWPWPASGPRQIDELRPMLESIPENALIAGDFNSVTWSHSLRRFAAMGGLSVVKGIGPSWGPGLTIGGRLWQWPQAIGLPLDNAMDKGAVRIVSATRLESLGSDHLPILIEFTLAE